MAKMGEAEISYELRNVMMKMQQLVEQKKMLFIMKELIKRVDCDSPEGGNRNANEQELNDIDKKLNQLEVIRAALQRRLDHPEKDHIPTLEKDKLPASSPVASPPQQKPPICVVDPFDISTVQPPPNYPAPEVTEDYENFQFTPTKTRCPTCSNFITTKTSSTVSSITWLVCMAVAMMGCVAGCCFIPFCVDRFKSTSHKCPKCDSLIATIKRL